MKLLIIAVVLALAILVARRGLSQRVTWITRRKVGVRKVRIAMRRSLSLTLVAILAVAGLASPGAAATIGDVRTVGQLGACIYISHKGTALGLLNASTAALSDEAFVRLRDERSCFDRLPTDSHLETAVATFSKGVIRGMIAEAALRDSSSAASLQPLPFQEKRYLRPWFIATGRDPAVDEMSACIADTDPSGILAVIATVPDSSQESWALGNISPWLGKCLAAGAQLQSDRIALRAALADALYQRVRDPQLSLVPAPAVEKHQ